MTWCKAVSFPRGGADVYEQDNEVSFIDVDCMLLPLGVVLVIGTVDP